MLATFHITSGLAIDPQMFAILTCLLSGVEELTRPVQEAFKTGPLLLVKKMGGVQAAFLLSGISLL